MKLSRGIPLPDDPPPRRPVNRVAARVTNRGERHRFPNRTDEVCVPLPLPMRAIPVVTGCPDLIGHRFGWFTVVGLADVANNPRSLIARKKKKAGAGGARWVCRCVCGMYALRSTRAVRVDPSTLEHVDRCFHCRQLDKLKNAKTR
jgi:hypothetical protein